MFLLLMKFFLTVRTVLTGKIRSMLVLNSGVHSSSNEERFSEASIRCIFIVNYLTSNMNLHSLPNSQKTWLASISKTSRRMLSRQNYGRLSWEANRTHKYSLWTEYVAVVFKLSIYTLTTTLWR